MILRGTYFYTYLDIPIVAANKNSESHCLQFDSMNVIPVLSLSLSLCHLGWEGMSEDASP